MAWTQKHVILCEPVTPAPELTPAGCLAGEGYSPGVIWVPSSDPSLPDMSNADISLYVFAVVIAVYVLSVGLGAAMNVFKTR